MKKEMLLLLSSSTALLAGNGHELEVEIPQLDVAEYHKPYVSVWVQNSKNEHVLDVSLWYEMGKGKKASKQDGHGTKWIKDLRKWWRVSGRELDFPVDGVSSPTKPPGKHRVSLDEKLTDLPPLEKGSYTLCVEAAREVGGRELLSIPFKWDGENLQPEGQSSVKGKEELGTITLK